jgi:hypothetical protein
MEKAPDLVEVSSREIEAGIEEPENIPSSPGPRDGSSFALDCI